MNPLKAFWIQSSNVGDTLTPVIVEHFTDFKLINVPSTQWGKLIAVGSTMAAVCDGDTVWGTGAMNSTDSFPNIGNCRFLAVRGKLTEKLLGVDVGVYGDPALLLSLMYKPTITKKYKLGLVPHYAEQDHPMWVELAKQKDSKFIDVNKPWREFVDDIVSCEEIISSSLHGIVTAESYGVPTAWMKLTDKVAGNGFKFRDYLSGTGREQMEEGLFPPIPDLVGIQEGLLKSLKHLKN